MHYLPSINYKPLIPYIPCLKPALKKDSIEIDEHLLDERAKLTKKVAGLIVIPKLAANFIPCLFFPTSLKMAVQMVHINLALGIPTINIRFLASKSQTIAWTVATAAFSLIFIDRLDRWLTESAADKKAVEEYIKADKPSQEVTDHILNNSRALKMLIQEKADLNKINENGDRLLDGPDFPDFEDFKLLVDNGADVKKTNRHNRTFFYETVIDSDPDMLEYLLKNGIVKAEDIDADQQVKLWKNSGCSKAGILLKEYVFLR